VGYTTGLVPSMTLGPGTWAGSSTSDNIGPLHLVNIKRLAGEIREYRREGSREQGAGPSARGAEAGASAPVVVAAGSRPKSPAPGSRVPELSPDEVRSMVDDFLRSHRAARSRA